MWIAAGDRARVVGCDVGSAAGALEAQAPCMSIRDERREGQCVQDMPLWYDRSSLGSNAIRCDRLQRAAAASPHHATLPTHPRSL